MRDIFHGNKVFMKKLADDALQGKTSNKTLAMETREQMKTILEMKVKLMPVNAIEFRTEKSLEICKKQRYMNSRDGRRRYV